MACKTAWETESSVGKELPKPYGPPRPKEIAVLPDICLAGQEAIKGDPTVVEQSLPHIDRFVGFNPYDTGILQKKLTDD